MDIHKPKPWHGWREFLKEYGIIVLGVLTALGAEQVAEWLHWREEVSVARKGVAFDLRRVIGQAAMTDVAAPCVAKRLGEFSDALDEAQVSKKLPPIGWGGGPPTPAWSIRSWSRLQSGQTLAHMSNRDQLMLAAINSTVEGAHVARVAEDHDWGVIETMVGPGRPSSDAEIASLRAVIGVTGQNAYAQRALGRQVGTLIVRSGFLSKKEIDDAYADGVRYGKISAFCHPTPSPFAHSRDMITRGLTEPPIKPGEGRVGTVGVNGALATDE